MSEGEGGGLLAPDLVLQPQVLLALVGQLLQQRGVLGEGLHHLAQDGDAFVHVVADAVVAVLVLSALVVRFLISALVFGLH